jgi:hypothetical protein
MYYPSLRALWRGRRAWRRFLGRRGGVTGWWTECRIWLWRLYKLDVDILENMSCWFSIGCATWSVLIVKMVHRCTGDLQHEPRNIPRLVQKRKCLPIPPVHLPLYEKMWFLAIGRWQGISDFSKGWTWPWYPSLRTPETRIWWPKGIARI